MDLPLIPFFSPFAAISAMLQWARRLPKVERCTDEMVVIGNVLPSFSSSGNAKTVESMTESHSVLCITVNRCDLAEENRALSVTCKYPIGD